MVRGCSSRAAWMTPQVLNGWQPMDRSGPSALARKRMSWSWPPHGWFCARTGMGSDGGAIDPPSRGSHSERLSENILRMVADDEGPTGSICSSSAVKWPVRRFSCQPVSPVEPHEGSDEACGRHEAKPRSSRGPGHGAWRRRRDRGAMIALWPSMSKPHGLSPPSGMRWDMTRGGCMVSCGSGLTVSPRLDRLHSFSWNARSHAGLRR